MSGVIAPASQIVTNPELITPHSFGEVYGGLRSTTTGNGSGNGNGNTSGLHGSVLESTVAVSSGQSKTLSVSTPTTVDVAADLAFKVTFQNAGDFPERGIRVTLTVSGLSKKQAYTKTETVPSIDTKERTTVTFTNLQLPPSTFGAQATVNVVVGKVPGEVKLDNNRASYPVFFSLPSNG